MKLLSKILLFFVCLSPLYAFAQSDLVEPTLMMRKRIQYGMNLNSAELGGLNFRYGWQKTATVKNQLDIELARLRHPKEERVYGQSENPDKYTPGRINMAFFFRTGIGQNLFITDRNYKNSVSLHYNYVIGVTTALLKPIYIEVLKPSPNSPTEAIVATERYDPVVEHIFPLAIYGNAPFSRGLNEITPRLGGYFKNSLAVEWGEYPDEFKSIEAGFCIDLFPRELPLMAPELTKNQALFFTLYLGLTFGQNK